MQNITYEDNKPEELYNAYSNLHIEAENTRYLSNLLGANWAKRAKQSNNKQQKQDMLYTSQMLHNLSANAEKKAEAALEKAEELREKYDFDYFAVSLLLNIVFY